MPFDKKPRLTPRELRKDLDRLTRDFDKLEKSSTKARRPVKTKPRGLIAPRR